MRQRPSHPTMTHHCFRLAFSAAALALLATAQVSYPQDGPRTSQGNLAPLGFSSAGTTDEARWQQLIPRRYLPSAGGVILGMSVISIPGPSQLTYARLDVTLSHVVATSLSTTFASNLPAPVPVLATTDTTFQFVQSDWSPTIQFTTPFAYDGHSDLVVDIRKVYDRTRHPSTATIMSSAISGNPGRGDLPFPRFASGAFGSGAVDATNATGSSSRVLKMRLHFVPADTIAVGSDRGGSANNVFAVGGSFWHRVAAAPGSRFVNLVWFAFDAVPTTVPTIQGESWLPLGVAVSWSGGMVGASGLDVQTVPIPAQPSLVGAQVTFQSLVLDPSATRIAFTNAADFLVNV